MIIVKITVFFFKVKLISYFLGELKISVLLFPQKAYMERRLWF
jgi:hypothetical protein